MPRKRRIPKLRLPEGLEHIDGCELAMWGVFGPSIGGEGWPSWDAFMDFYAAVREDWRSDRPWLRERSAVERLYVAWTRGAAAEALDALQSDIEADVWANDPRPLLREGSHAS